MQHQFSNFQVDVYVLVLENDGSCLAAAITCANLALANAGVPMHDLVTGVSLVNLLFYRYSTIILLFYGRDDSNPGKVILY